MQSGQRHEKCSRMLFDCLIVWLCDHLAVCLSDHQLDCLIVSWVAIVRNTEHNFRIDQPMTPGCQMIDLLTYDSITIPFTPFIWENQSLKQSCKSAIDRHDVITSKLIKSHEIDDIINHYWLNCLNSSIGWLPHVTSSESTADLSECHWVIGWLIDWLIEN